MPTFTVMTWNVENLFPPGTDLGNGAIVQQGDYDAKLDLLRDEILAINPDVLALQEIGSRSDADNQSLSDLQARLGPAYAASVQSSFPDGRRIRVAFLSRLTIEQSDHLVNFAPGPLGEAPDWPPKPPIKRMGRGALTIVVGAAPGVRVRLTTVHLKSKLVTYPAAGGGTRFQPRDEDERTTGEGLALLRRGAESTAVRAHLNDVMQPGDTTHTVVLGDLNDEPHAATSELILGPEDADVTRPDQLDPVRLYNLMDALPRQGGAANDKWFLDPAERFTRIYKGRGELIDHILVSKGLLGESADLQQDRWRVKEVRSLVQGIQSIGDNPSARVSEHRPDHAPVFARFEF